MAGLQYVSDFSFPKEMGFSGSAGVQQVRGYQRGGRVKMPPNVKAKGGAARMRGGGSTHDKLTREGEKMGYAYGGQVKDTSSEFVQTSGRQGTMDNANYPPGQASNARDKESGPRRPLRPRFGAGGEVYKTRDMPKPKRGAKPKRITAKAKPRPRASDMPPGVKAQGGLAHATGYAEGGYTGKAKPSDLGTGAARRNIAATKVRQKRTRASVDAVLRAGRKSMGVDKKPKPKAKSGSIQSEGRKSAPGSERGRRPHYGLPFKESPVKKR